MNDIMVNRIPSLTWNWLHMNETKVSRAVFDREGAVKISVPDTITEKISQDSVLKNISGGMGEDTEKLASESGIRVYGFAAPAGIKEKKPVLVDITYEKEGRNLNRVDLTADEESSMTVIMDFSGGSNGQALIQTKLHISRNAKICLVQVFRPGQQFTLLDDVGILCEDNAHAEIIQLVLGEGDVYLGVRNTLKGREAGFDSDLCYLLDGEQKLDVNYVADHFGKKTLSRMDASGVLKGNSHKLFRGTIDFKNGSSGAKGDEKEDVLLLSDSAVNQTIPLILCQEEDVEGNHGATIGRLDEELLFYLESRGIKEEDIYRMMADARVDALCRKIPDAKARERIRGYAGIGGTDFAGEGGPESGQPVSQNQTGTEE